MFSFFGTILLVCLWVVPAFAQDITTGLVGWWKLDEGTGTNAADSSASNNPGTLTAGPAWATGQLGGAVAFTRSSQQYITIPDAAPLDITGELTLATWVKPTNLTEGEHHEFINKTACPSTCDTNYGFGWEDFGNLRFYFANPANVYQIYLTTSAVVSVGTWTHVAVTYKLSTSTIVVYVNGSSVTGFASGGSPTTTAILTNAHPLLLGAFTTGDATGFLNGALDDVRVYNRALTAGDITALYAYTGAGGPSLTRRRVIAY
jgi:large repetitive protein